MRIILIASVVLAASVSMASAQVPTMPEQTPLPTAPAPQAAAPAPAAQPAAPTPAQQFPMDHGRAEDEANAAKAADIQTAAKAAAEAAVAEAASAPPAESTESAVNGSAVIAPEPPRTPDQRQADVKAESAWQARCRPTTIEDRDGFRRVKYAESDCDLSRYNTAGK